MPPPQIVFIGSSGFTPADLTVGAGEWVHWENKDTKPHCLRFSKPTQPESKQKSDAAPQGPSVKEAEKAAALACPDESPSIPPGATFDHLFASAGIYEYVGDDGKMKGKITVA